MKCSITECTKEQHNQYPNEPAPPYCSDHEYELDMLFLGFIRCEHEKEDGDYCQRLGVYDSWAYADYPNGEYPYRCGLHGGEDYIIKTEIPKGKHE